MNEGNLIFFLGSKDIGEWNEIIIIKKIKKVKKNRVKNGSETFYLRFFGTNILYHKKAQS